MVDVWSTIRQERAALADDLAGLTEEQWQQPSLCAGWTIQDVVAHQTGTASVTVPGFFAGMIRAGFSLRRMQEKAISTHRGASGAEALASFRSVVDRTSAPPGPTETWLGEAIIHAEDVRRPLGLRHDYPIDAVVAVADTYKASNLVMGSKRRIAGLHLTATDAEWTHGDGPEVSGPMLDLLLAMTGRKSACDNLSGEGVDTLRSRD